MDHATWRHQRRFSRGRPLGQEVHSSLCSSTHQPKGGIPGLDPEDVIEVVGNVYGANDASRNWFTTFDSDVKKGGWQQSQFDPCLYFLRDSQGCLCGVLGAHVDDTITGHLSGEVGAAAENFPENPPTLLVSK